MVTRAKPESNATIVRFISRLNYPLFLDSGQRIALIEKIAGFGSRAKNALTVLTVFLADPNPNVRQSATDAILKIDKTYAHRLASQSSLLKRLMDGKNTGEDHNAKAQILKVGDEIIPAFVGLYKLGSVQEKKDLWKMLTFFKPNTAKGIFRLLDRHGTEMELVKLKQHQAFRKYLSEKERDEANRRNWVNFLYQLVYSLDLGLKGVASLHKTMQLSYGVSTSHVYGLRIPTSKDSWGLYLTPSLYVNVNLMHEIGFFDAKSYLSFDGVVGLGLGLDSRASAASFFLGAGLGAKAVNGQQKTLGFALLAFECALYFYNKLGIKFHLSFLTDNKKLDVSGGEAGLSLVWHLSVH